MIRALLFSAILVSCAVEPTRPTSNPAVGSLDHTIEYDPEFLPTIEEFQVRSVRANNPLDMSILKTVQFIDRIVVYGEDGGVIESVVGVCWKSGSRRDIQIEPHFYFSKSEIEGKALLIHELAHCMLDSPHKTESITDFCPSVMRPYISSQETLATCWHHMMADLFKPAQAKLHEEEHCFRQGDGSEACVLLDESDIATTPSNIAGSY
jgi:hypothetical protein